MKLQFSVPHQLELMAMTQPWELQVTGPEQLKFVRFAETLGFDMVSVPEHLAIPREHGELSGPFYMNAAVGMAAYVGATERMRVNSCIALLPLQHPITTAKQIATMDWLSGGRVTVTWAVGWCAGEFDLLGVEFSKRGEIAEEYTQAIVELWTNPDPQFEGKYVSFKNLLFEPRCLQTPHVPIWFGGDADPVLRRVARYATGWWPFLTPPEQLPDKIDFIKSQPDYNGQLQDICTGLGRRVGEGHVAVDNPAGRPNQSKQAIIDRLGWLERQGVTMSGLPIPELGAPEQYYDYAQWIAEEIMPVVR